MGTWSRCCAAAAAAGGEFLQFCENVPKRCWWGEGGGEGAPLVREQVMVMGRHRCDALGMGTCAAAGSFAQLNNLILWTQCVIEG